MRRSAIDRAADWIRRALRNPGDCGQGGGEVVAAAEMPRIADPLLLDYVAEELSLRADALRRAMGALDPNQCGSSREAHAHCMEEIDGLEELALGLGALAVDPSAPPADQSFDVTDAMRRAVKRLDDHRAQRGGIRIRTDRAVPRVLARDPALSRTLALCFSICEIAASPGSALAAEVSVKNDRVVALFHPASVTSVLPPRQRERFHAMMGLAGRLAASFGARLELVERSGIYTPRLSLLAS
jgi:hypothetical protein